MPQRENEKNNEQGGAPSATPDARQPLSGQERHDLAAAAEGYDASASALPDDGTPPAPPKADAKTANRHAAEHPPKDRSPKDSSRKDAPPEAPASTQQAFKNAEREGLVPEGGTSAPPIDGQP